MQYPDRLALPHLAQSHLTTPQPPELAQPRLTIHDRGQQVSPLPDCFTQRGAGAHRPAYPSVPASRRQRTQGCPVRLAEQRGLRA